MMREATNSSLGERAMDSRDVTESRSAALFRTLESRASAAAIRLFWFKLLSSRIHSKAVADEI